MRSFVISILATLAASMAACAAPSIANDVPTTESNATGSNDKKTKGDAGARTTTEADGRDASAPRDAAAPPAVKPDATICSPEGTYDLTMVRRPGDASCGAGTILGLLAVSPAPGSIAILLNGLEPDVGGDFDSDACTLVANFSGVSLGAVGQSGTLLVKHQLLGSSSTSGQVTFVGSEGCRADYDVVAIKR